MSRAMLERIERSYRTQHWIAGAFFVVAVYLLAGCLLKSSYLIFKSSGIYNSDVLERVFYQLYFWAFNKPLGENFGEKLWRMLPILQGRDLIVRENIFLIMFYLATFLSAGHFRLCGARIARLNRLKREAEDDIIRDAYRGVEPARPESVMEPQRVDYLWTRKEKVIDRYLAPLQVGSALLVAQYCLERFA